MRWPLFRTFSLRWVHHSHGHARTSETGTRNEKRLVFERFLAFAIDVIKFSILFGVFANLLYLSPERLATLVSAPGVPLFLLSRIYFEATYGRTVGEMGVEFFVVTGSSGPIDYREWRPHRLPGVASPSATGSDAPICYRESTIRSLLRIVDPYPYPLYIVGLAATYVTDRDQRLGDVVAIPWS